MALPLLLYASFILSVSAQSTSTAPTSNVTPNITVIRETTSFTTTSVTSAGSQTLALVNVLPTVLNVTLTIAVPTPTSSNATASASSTPNPDVLATKIDPAFGVLGMVLILTGLPSAFLGHKNRWSSFFLIGFYTLSLVCFCLIVKFGILRSINPPSSTVRGMFVLSSFVAGIAGGGFAVFFWQATKYLIGAWGGLAFGLWVQCFRDGGLIRPVGIRWLLFITCAVIGFVLCTIPKIHYQVLLVATAIVGSTAVILGVDCFSTAGLKEFYMWNIGYRQLFPKYISHDIQFPVTQSMEIEIGLIGAVWLMGIAVQLRVLQVLQRKLKEIKAEQKRRERLDEAKNAERFSRLEQEKDSWEREHSGLVKHDRTDSEFSGTTLHRGGDGSMPRADDPNFGTRPRRSSCLSEFLAAGAPEEELKRATMRNSQSPGALPVLDLGSDIKDDVPRAFVSGETAKAIPGAKPEDLKVRNELLQEIQTIRRSIDILKSETPQPSSGSSSRQPSLASHARTLSYDLNSTVLSPSHQRPPRQPDPRARIQSMDFSALGAHVGHTIGRPTSAPLRDDDWDSYLRDRKLVQPPAGVSAPIATTPCRLSFQHLALLDSNAIEGDKADSPTSVLHRRATSSPLSGSYMPPTILPPRKTTSPPAQQPRTVTYEELTERHREKLRELQAPLTNAENEQAEVVAAKARWERSKTAERQAVTKRQARAAAAQAKESRRHHSEDTTQERNDVRQSSSRRNSAIRHSRSRSADKLGTTPSSAVRQSSTRMSTLKVEDWQRYQAEQGQSPSSPTRRDSGVPFPDSKGHERRSSRRSSGLPREPPN
ncbi:hypothetical protein BGY98DRAFT_1087853 [Russula aff. rugulosa BPL654]|nr:hypothetical protein BGY98DRAFT_1087853 [Russula aff. rugulosa BPL654]